MRTDSASFNQLSKELVIEPRYVLAIYFGAADITYLTSHADGIVPPGVAAIDRIDSSIVSITGQSQRINPDRAQHSIGAVTITLADVDGELSTKIKTKLDGGDGLRKKKAVIYTGHALLSDPTLGDWDDYSRRLTYLIENVSYRDGVYSLRLNDIQRQVKENIFEIHSGVLTSTISAAATSIPITIASASDKFPTLQHDANYSANSSATVGYIKIDNEIICHSGWNGGFTALTVVERGALNTRAAIHSVTASEDDQKKKVNEYVYIEMAAPRMIYAILTGVIEEQAGNMPDHWHLNIDTEFVNLSDFQTIGDDLWNLSDDSGRIARFMGIEKQKGKSFIEKELLAWSGCFMPVGSDGALGLRRLYSVLPYADYFAHITESVISSYSELRYDQQAVINNFSVRWNWLDNLDRYTKTTVLLDSDSIAKHGRAPVRTFEFRGVFSGIHSDQDILNYFNQLRDRYAAPPLTLTVTILPGYDELEVGDPVRVTASQIWDYNLDESLDRVFEVQQVLNDWVTGKVTLKLFGGVEPASQNAIAATAKLADSYYTATGTELSTVLTISGGAVTANGTLTGGASTRTVFYYDGDLTINSGITVTITGNVELRIKGGLTINGAIDGVANGHAGATGYTGLLGNQGTTGAIGNPGWNPGMFVYDGAGSQFIANLHYPAVAQPPPRTVTGLNILNPDGLGLTGIPANLQGSSGSAGHPSFQRVPDHSYPFIGTDYIQASGGAGGASGAGLLIVSRTGAFGASGSIDLSGAAGAVGGSTVLNSVTYYAGSGVGGSPGALIWLIDTDGSLPSKTKTTANNGASPIASAANYIGPVPIPVWSVSSFVTTSGGTLGIKNGRTVNDKRDETVFFGYVPAALNGYVQLPADEEQEVTGYENKPINWENILDDKNAALGADTDAMNRRLQINNWDEQTNPKDFSLNQVFFGNGFFVAGGADDGTDAYLVTSPFGKVWTERANPATKIEAITYGDGLWVAGTTEPTDLKGVMTATDPTGTWTLQTTPEWIQTKKILFANSIWVAVGKSGSLSQSVMTATDPTGTWTLRTTPTTTARWFSVTYSPELDLWVALGSGTGGYFPYSAPDPTGTWTERANGTGSTFSQFFDVTWTGTSFIAVGRYSNTGLACIIRSLDGITWTEVVVTFDDYLTSVISTSDFVVTCGIDNKMHISEDDGLTWTQVPIDSSASLLGLTYGRGRYVTVGINEGGDATLFTSLSIQ